MQQTEQIIKVIDPDLVLVPGNRVRKQFKKDDLLELAQSFQSIGQAQPGICIEVEGRVILVAGERRLKACQMIKMPFSYVTRDSVDEDYLREIEIEENLRRVDFTWQEEVEARQELHELRERKKKKLGLKQTVRDTAKELKESVGGTQEILEVASFMKEFPEVEGAKSLSEAKKVVKKLKGIALRQHFLGKAVEDAHESTARVETAPEKTGAEELTALREEVVEVAGFRMPTSKLLDFDRRVIEGSMEEKLSDFKDESVNIVLFDPPWGVNYNQVRIQTGGTDDFEDSSEYLFKNLKIWLDLLYQKMAPDSHLYMFFGIRYHAFIYHRLKAAGFTVNGLPIYWIKMGTHHTRNPEIWPGRAVEPIAFARKGSKKIVKVGQPDYIITAPPNPRMKQHHPSAKHPDVFMELIQRSAMPGDVILDPMCGSGMAGVAAQVYQATHKLDWWLIEREKSFRDLALENCLLGYHQIVAKNTANELPGDSSTGRQYEERLVEKEKKVGDDFKKLTPGTEDWKIYWKWHPEAQEAMLAYARERKE
jgi:ParB-like chromosome segregation protein Spo0J/DNA modification methylase